MTDHYFLLDKTVLVRSKSFGFVTDCSLRYVWTAVSGKPKLVYIFGRWENGKWVEFSSETHRFIYTPNLIRFFNLSKTLMEVQLG